MHARVELGRLLGRADAAWRELDDLLGRRNDALAAASGPAGEPTPLSRQEADKLARSVEALDRIRCERDLLSLGAVERQIRLVASRCKESAASAALTAAEQAIVDGTETYDGIASVYNIRLRRFPERVIARLEHLRPLPLIEFVEPF
jgi:hypothetical protein